MKRSEKTPSRTKYEQSHPVVSFRCSKELHEGIVAVKKAEGKSVTDLVKIGLGLLEVKVTNEKKIRLQAYDEGWEKGIASAEKVYKVTIPCSVCGKEIEVIEDNDKEAIRAYLREQGWGHAGCVNRG